MTFPANPGEVGGALLTIALRDYLAADPNITSLLPSGADSIIPEGFFDHETPTPAVMIAFSGDDSSAEGNTVLYVRYALVVLDRGRGGFDIERVIHALRKRLNDTASAMAFFTFAPEADLVVFHLETTGTSVSTAFATWRAEGRDLGVVFHIQNSLPNE